MMSDRIFSIFENTCPDCGSELGYTTVEVHPDNVEDWTVDKVIERPNFARTYGEYDKIMAAYTARCDTCEVDHYVEQSGGSGDWS
jgi:hypothetical protein